jgi:hypothetical protein
MRHAPGHFLTFHLLVDRQPISRHRKWVKGVGFALLRSWRRYVQVLGRWKTRVWLDAIPLAEESRA